MLPEVNGQKVHPIRASFNEGFFFLRVYDIFATYESQMQVYDQLFLALHKVGDINAEDGKSIQAKMSQFSDPTVFTYTTINSTDSTTTIDNLNLTRHLSQLDTSYDNIHNRLNDRLARLGLAGDDSVKPERITTGENFRALQPTTAFQLSILSKLRVVSRRMVNRFGQEVKFTIALHPNSQGIPQTENNGEQSSITKDNDKS